MAKGDGERSDKMIIVIIGLLIIIGVWQCSKTTKYIYPEMCEEVTNG